MGTNLRVPGGPKPSSNRAQPDALCGELVSPFAVQRALTINNDGDKNNGKNNHDELGLDSQPLEEESIQDTFSERFGWCRFECNLFLHLGYNNGLDKGMQTKRKHSKTNAFFVPSSENTVKLLLFCPQLRQHSKTKALFCPELRKLSKTNVCFRPKLRKHSKMTRKQKGNTVKLMFFLSPALKTQYNYCFFVPSSDNTVKQMRFSVLSSENQINCCFFLS